MGRRGKSRGDKRRANIRRQQQKARQEAESRRQETATAPAIHSECPSCGQHIEFATEWLGTLYDCPKCGDTLQLCSGISFAFQTPAAPSQKTQASAQSEDQDYVTASKDYRIAIYFRNFGIVLFFLNFLVSIFELAFDNGLFWFWWILPFSITCITSGHFLSASVVKNNMRLNKELLYQEQLDEREFQLQKEAITNIGSAVLVTVIGTAIIGGILYLIPWGSMVDWIEKKEASYAVERASTSLTKALTLSESDKVHIQEAINELQRLNSALEIGTTLNDYTRLLNDVHAKVQTHLDSLPEFNAETGAGLGAIATSNRIKNCLDAFVRVHTVWKDMIFGDKWHKGEKAYSMST